jgi:parallel beta-helix repeat protein
MVAQNKQVNLMRRNNSIFKMKIMLSFFILMFILSMPIASGKIIYVDDDAAGANDGSNWENAYTYLQDALADANESEKPIEIRVAQGLYIPTSYSDSNNIADPIRANRQTFQLINGVTVRGGYAGFDEPEPNVRDINLYQTILSGDLNGDDIDVNDPHDLLREPTRYDNSLHVVTGSNTDATAVLDGFTISDGAIWVFTSFRLVGAPAGGAGMIIFSGSPTITDCTFTNNVTGNSGGGLLIYDGSNPTLFNCKFKENYADRGGGMCAVKNSNPTLFNCTFSDNFVSDEGGGMRNISSNPTLTNCIFSHNSALKPSIYSSSTEGGGMLNFLSNPMLTNCKFIENSADRGGGMYNEDSNTELNTCEFISNMASRNGGAVYTNNGQLIAKGCTFKKNYQGAIEDYSEIGSIFTNCTFSANSTLYNGGAVSVTNAIFENCIFTGNRALGYESGSGGAVHIMGGAPYDEILKFNNCTFSDNWAKLGCSLYCTRPVGSIYVNNCIFWGTEDQINIDDLYAAPTFVCYSVVQGDWEGRGNIDEDPLVANPGYWADANNPNIIAEPNDPNAMWIEGNYHLKSQAGRYDPNSGSWIIDDITSPCIDAGDPNSPVGDEPEPNGGRINMGAYGGTIQASKSYAEESLVRHYDF